MEELLLKILQSGFIVYTFLSAVLYRSEWTARKTPSHSMKTIIDLYGTIQFFCHHDSFTSHLLAELYKSIDLLVENRNCEWSNHFNVLDKT